jgi:hypothetical protein
VAINKELSLSELEDEKVKTKYVLYENYVCDVGSFINSHPGGRNMIKENLYVDVGRYITGTQGYSKEIGPHNHNFATVKHMIMKLAYAQVKQDNMLVLNKSDQGRFLDVQVTVETKREIAKDTFEYRFNIGQHQFAKYLEGFKWMGRHFTISNYGLTKTRYYSICLALDENYRTKFNQMLDNARESKMITSDVKLKVEERQAAYISFYIKLYRHPDALSSCIYENQSVLNLKGPFVNIL